MYMRFRNEYFQLFLDTTKYLDKLKVECSEVRSAVFITKVILYINELYEIYL